MYLALDKGMLRLERGGHCVFTGEEWTNHPHRHPDYQEICWVTGGSGVFYHGQQRFDVCAGSCFISEPDVVHEIASPDHGHLQLFFMTFHVETGTATVDPEMKSMWQHYQRGHQIHCHLAQLAEYSYLINTAPPLRQDLLMRALFLESLAALSGCAQQQSVDLVQVQERYAEHAMAIIRERCCTGLTVGEIAAAVALSERQLRRCFKRRFNCGLVEAINAARLDQAKRLLLMQRHIAAVAAAVGIASPAMFSRLFKQAFGCTPSAWRQQQVQSGILPRTVFGRD